MVFRKMFCLILFFLLFMSVAQAQVSIPGDNVMRYYRVALPVSYTSCQEDFYGNTDDIKKFWSEVEEYLNRVYLPLGFCFKVCDDPRLIQSSYNIIDENFMNAPSYGTELLDDVIGTSAYDVGLWIVHRPEGSENTGLALTGGAYNPSYKASAYAAADPWVVAHEMAHLFGATHTMDGSLMDTGGDFLSLTSIREIRSSCKEHNAPYYEDVDRTVLVGANSGGNYVFGQKVSNTSPYFASSMPGSFRIPEGACFRFEVPAEDMENNRLTYAVLSEDFAVLPPDRSNVIDYRPDYVADIFDEQYYYIVAGTDIPNMWPGAYSMTVSVNDMPSGDLLGWDYLMECPFYSNYATREIGVEIVGGEPFAVSLYPDKRHYLPGEHVKISWGVNQAYFTDKSRLRISLSTDYGKTFSLVLAESVPALDGQYDVVMPNMKIDDVNVDFSTAIRSMRAGIIRVEEIGGPAYNLSCLSPENGGGFTLSGTEIPSSITFASQENPMPTTDELLYDLSGRRYSVTIDHNHMQSPGIYISGNRKIVVR